MPALQGKGSFMRARLQQGQEKWELIKITGWARVEKLVYFLDGKKWHYAKSRYLIWGQILGNDIKLFIDPVLFNRDRVKSF